MLLIRLILLGDGLNVVGDNNVVSRSYIKPCVSVPQFNVSVVSAVIHHTSLEEAINKLSE